MTHRGEPGGCGLRGDAHLPTTRATPCLTGRRTDRAVRRSAACGLRTPISSACRRSGGACESQEHGQRATDRAVRRCSGRRWSPTSSQRSMAESMSAGTPKALGQTRCSHSPSLSVTADGSTGCGQPTQRATDGPHPTPIENPSNVTHSGRKRRIIRVDRTRTSAATSAFPVVPRVGRSATPSGGLKTRVTPPTVGHTYGWSTLVPPPRRQGKSCPSAAVAHAARSRADARRLRSRRARRRPRRTTTPNRPDKGGAARSDGGPRPTAPLRQQLQPGSPSPQRGRGALAVATPRRDHYETCSRSRRNRQGPSPTGPTTAPSVDASWSRVRSPSCRAFSAA